MILFLKHILIILFMYEFVYTCQKDVGGQLQERVLSCHMDQILWIDTKWIYPLSHLPDWPLFSNSRYFNTENMDYFKNHKRRKKQIMYNLTIHHSFKTYSLKPDSRNVRQGHEVCH